MEATPLPQALPAAQPPFQLDKRSSLRHFQQLSTPNAATVHLMPWIGIFLQEERYSFTSTQILMVEALVIPDDGELT
jgi:hypothetical protein